MRRLLECALTIAVVWPLTSVAQDPEASPSYRLTAVYVKELARQNTLLFELPLTIEGRTANVHPPESDCEMHLAGSSGIKIGFPGKVIVEPPNLCRFKPSKSQGKSWGKVFDDHVLNRPCVAIGYPRLYAEHIKNGKPPANPPHMVEIHPALQIKCDASTQIDFSRFLTIVPGMTAIQPESADQCVDGYRLWVRQKGSEYEFLEERPGKCGNFAIIDAVVDPRYVRKVSGGHSAIAQAWAVEGRSHPLKLYTYEGTPEDNAITAIGAANNDEPNQAMPLQGLLTIDYFAVLKTLRDTNGNWLTIPQWTEVKFPLAFVVFGKPQ